MGYLNFAVMTLVAEALVSAGRVCDTIGKTVFIVRNRMATKLDEPYEKAAQKAGPWN